MNKQPIFIDCDPGLDDFIAILAALRAPHFDVVALAGVAGNLPVETTTSNIAKILELAGRGDIPFAAGAARPLVRQPVTAEAVHGESGLGGVMLPEPSLSPVSRDASAFLIEKAKEYPGGLTVLAIGPLTNLARAITACPALPGLLRGIVLMGGGHAHGNVTPKAEFNIFADPHAAHIVFTSGADLTMVGLDATMAVGFDAAQCEALCAEGGTGPAVRTALADIRRYSIGWGLGDIAHVHDLSAVLCAVWPELFTLTPCHVDIELKGQHTFGQTVCDLTGVGGKPHNARVAMGVPDEEAYRAAVCKLLTGV